MGRVSRFPQEVRERAVWMVFDHGSEYGSEWEAICSTAGCRLLPRFWRRFQRHPRVGLHPAAVGRPQGELWSCPTAVRQARRNNTLIRS